MITDRDTDLLFMGRLVKITTDLISNLAKNISPCYLTI